MRYRSFQEPEDSAETTPTETPVEETQPSEAPEESTLPPELGMETEIYE